LDFNPAGIENMFRVSPRMGPWLLDFDASGVCFTNILVSLDESILRKTFWLMSGALKLLDRILTHLASLLLIINTIYLLENKMFI
jgi:hypothetical protein